MQQIQYLKIQSRCKDLIEGFQRRTVGLSSIASRALIALARNMPVKSWQYRMQRTIDTSKHKPNPKIAMKPTYKPEDDASHT